MFRPSDTYIAKDSAINEEIDKLRLSATAALIGAERRHYRMPVCPVFTGWEVRWIIRTMMVSLRPGMEQRP